MKQRTVGFILMSLAALGLAVAATLMKIIPEVTNLGPGDVAIWRFSIAAPVLWVALFFHQPSERYIPEKPFLLLGLGVVYSIASFSALFALSRLPASIYVILIYIYPALVVLFSILTGRSVPRLSWLGLPLTFIGLFLTSYEFGQALVIDPIGLAITMVNALAMATYFLAGETVFKSTHDRLLGTGWVLTGAMISGLVVIPVIGAVVPDSLMGWIYLISLSIFGTLMPILAMNYGTQLTGAARGSVIITLQPVLAVIFALIFLNETLSLQQWIGGSMVVMAIFVIQKSRDRKRRQRQASNP